MEDKEIKIKQKIQLKDILANAAKLKEGSKIQQIQNIHSSRLENLIGAGGIQIQSVSNEVLYNATTEDSNPNRMYFGGLTIDPNYILSKGIISPVLTTEEVRNAFGVKSNKDVFTAIFTGDEIVEIASAILGMKTGKFSIEKDLKN